MGGTFYDCGPAPGGRGDHPVRARRADPATARWSVAYFGPHRPSACARNSSPNTPPVNNKPRKALAVMWSITNRPPPMPTMAIIQLRTVSQCDVAHVSRVALMMMTTYGDMIT